MRQQVSLIIPFLNESENIRVICQELNSFSQIHKDVLELEVLFVNDGSTDNSQELIQSQNLIPKTKIIQLSRNYGSHIAFRAGLQHASYDIVTQTSSDFQNPLHLITDMLEAMQKTGKKFIIAQRKNSQKIGFFEKSFSSFYTFLLKKYAIENYPDGGFDIFMIGPEIKRLMNNNVENNSSILLQMLSFGFPYEVVHYQKNDRHAGRSKWTFSKKIKLLIDSFIAFSYTPIRFVSLVGVLFFTFGVLWTIYIISRKLLYNDLASGWPALTSILLLGFGITNIALGIIAEYLWRTLDVSRNRPVFIIDSIIDVNSPAN